MKTNENEWSSFCCFRALASTTLARPSALTPAEANLILTSCRAKLTSKPNYSISPISGSCMTVTETQYVQLIASMASVEFRHHHETRQYGR